MILPDVNVLVYAFRADAPDHPRYRTWLERAFGGPQIFGLSDHVLSGFVRVVTHPKIFAVPSRIDMALGAATVWRSLANCVPVSPGDRHWSIFEALCRKSGAKGNLAADAFLAALAIEHGCEWITTDRDFSRFEGLTWRHPLVLSSTPEIRPQSST